MPKYTVPAIDPDSGIDSYTGSGYVDLDVWEERVLERDLAALRTTYQEMVAADADDESIGYAVDGILFDAGLLGRFMEERWAALYGDSGYSRIYTELTSGW